MKINPYLYGVLVLVVFLGIIYGFQAAGVWSTSGQGEGPGQRTDPSATDASTVKGWMTLEQVSATYGVPVAEILSAFDLPADTPPGTAIKELEGGGFTVSALRTWLQER